MMIEPVGASFTRDSRDSYSIPDLILKVIDLIV